MSDAKWHSYITPNDMLVRRQSATRRLHVAIRLETWAVKFRLATQRIFSECRGVSQE